MPPLQPAATAATPPPSPSSGTSSPRLRPASGELLHLDLLRFVAACGVMLLHFSRFLSPGTSALLGPLAGLTLLVDLFFVLSGFVIAYVYAGRIAGWRDYLAFLRRRIARLAPLHWATLAIFTAIGALVWSGAMPSAHAGHYDPACLPFNLLALHALGTCRDLSFNYVSWSISAEWAMYLVTPLLLAGARRSPLVPVALAGAAIVVLSSVPHQPWLGWTWHFGAARAFPGFSLGIALGGWRAAIVRWMPAPRAVLVAAAALLLVGVHARWPLPALLPVVYLIVAATIAADLGGRYAPPRIGALGQLSYGIYMLHPVVQTVMLGFAGRRVLGLEGVAADLAVGAGMAATLALAFLSYTRFEMPARRWLNAGAPRPA